MLHATYLSECCETRSNGSSDVGVHGDVSINEDPEVILTELFLKCGNFQGAVHNRLTKYCSYQILYCWFGFQ